MNGSPHEFGAPELVGGALAAGGVLGWFFKHFSRGRSHINGKVRLSDEPQTVEFRTRMAVVMERQQDLTERIAEHMSQQTTVLVRLADVLEQHQRDAQPAIIAALDTHAMMKRLAERRQR